MPYQYPPAQPTLSGDVESISRFLKTPPLVVRKLGTLLDRRYISDAILSRRLKVVGGSIMYETGEAIGADTNPRAVSPGGEYPLTSLATGTASLAKTTKWGEDAEITDEAIARQNWDPVMRGLEKLAVQNVTYVDSVAMGIIASAVSQSTNAAADWSTATGLQIYKDAMLAAANIRALNLGFDPDTVVVDDINHALAMAAFLAAGYFSRENNGDNPALTGQFPIVGGLRWLPTPNVVAANTALVLDSKQLGGMADEDLGGPGYSRSGVPGAAPVEVKTIRDDNKDQWRIRARRVTVPVVLEPSAAWKIAAI